MSIQFLSVIALFLQLHSTAQDVSSPASPFTSTTTITPAAPFVIEFKAVVVNQKIQLNWKAAENQSISLFEVEKSPDGKHFTLAALVFGTDNASADDYLFFEKKTGKKMTYRVKIVSRDKQVYYSPTVTAG